MLTLNHVPPHAVTPKSKLGVFQRILTFMNSAPVAYVLMACVILKLLWGMWDFRDLTYGDSAAYYTNTCISYDRLRFNLAWTPLFELLGTLILHISHQPFMYCILMRLTLVLTLGLLAFATTRRLFPPLVAWAVSIWWVTLPVTFNTLFEVHLLGTVPIIATWLILSGDDGSNQKNRWRRGCAIAVMAGATALVRNEQVLYLSLFLPAVVLAEYSNWRKSTSRQSIKALLYPYVVPLLIVATIVGVFYIRALDRYPHLSEILDARHTTNMGQIYCFGFQQRHPGVWNRSAWTEYQDLMTKTFGKPQVTMTEALKANPAAMAEHFFWNASLIPSGLQMLMFNRISGGVTPDYIRVPVSYIRATISSALVILTVILGLLTAIRQRPATLIWLKQRRWVLTAMACYVPVSFFVMVMQRPRSSYVMALGFELMALTGFCLWRLFANTRLAHAAAFLCPAVMLLTVFITKPFYENHRSDQRLMKYVEFLKPFRSILAEGKNRVFVPDFSCELCCYLYDGDGAEEVKYFTNSLPLNQVRGGDLSGFLQRNGIEHVFVDFPWRTDPMFHKLETAKGWKLAALEKLPTSELALYTRSDLSLPVQKKSDCIGH